MADTPSAPALTFHETTFDLVEHEPGSIWLRGGQIAPALGYSDRRDLTALYAANAAEFTPRMTALVRLPTAGGVQEVRIFSLRGAHLLGMFARTARAAEFRRWVLDVLDREAATPAPPPAPAAAPPLDPTLRKLVAAWLLQKKPHYHRVIHYYGIAGLTHAERARLMGWKSTTQFFHALRELAAAGLVDWSPDPKRQALGRAQAERLRQAHQDGQVRIGRKKGTGASAERMALVRAARIEKLAAIAGGAQ